MAEQETIAEREGFEENCDGISATTTGLRGKVQLFHFGGILNWKHLTEEQCEQWAKEQRSRYRRGLLSPEQIAACESISDDWSWELKVNRGVLPFEEARAFARSLQLPHLRAWSNFVRTNTLPSGIPRDPARTYANKGWIGGRDWLGTNQFTQRTKLPFKEARAFIRTLGLSTHQQWRDYYKSSRPSGIPSQPNKVYANEGWAGWADWLGRSGRRPFEEARAFARSLGLKDRADWGVYCKSGKKPADIPAGAEPAYKGKGWVSWGDWLGTGNTRGHSGNVQPFEEVRAFVRSLNLKGSRGWRAYCRSDKCPADIPTAVERVYKAKGWVSWDDFLGTVNTRGHKAKAAGA